MQNSLKISVFWAVLQTQGGVLIPFQKKFKKNVKK